MHDTLQRALSTLAHQNTFTGALFVGAASYAIAALAMMWAALCVYNRGTITRATAGRLMVMSVLALVAAKVANGLILDPRPYLLAHRAPLAAVARDNGFPSDHVLLAADLAAALYWIDRPAVPLFTLGALIVAAGRLGIDAHHTLDVLGSGGIILISALVAARLPLGPSWTLPLISPSPSVARPHPRNGAFIMEIVTSPFSTTSSIISPSIATPLPPSGAARTGTTDIAQRLGAIMVPDATNPREGGGVLNPAGVIDANGDTYLFPRVVERPNLSRVGVARALYDDQNRPVAVERLGYALEPHTRYERRGRRGGGCEDPRVTWLDDMGRAVMAYTGFGAKGPRAAIASSRNLHSWERHGTIDFASERGFAWNNVDNKDALILPRPVRGPDGRTSLCVAHRPMFTGALPPGVTTRVPSLWLSYMPWIDARLAVRRGERLRVSQHTLVAVPEQEWELFRIGWGAIPLETSGGLLAIIHGVQRIDGRSRYCAGALMLDPEDPRRVLARTRDPLMEPGTTHEQVGVVNDVVFPTYAEPRGDGVDLYYGMADERIGVAHITNADLASRLIPTPALQDRRRQAVG